MKALTVWQPWASLIAIGAKPYEFRGWACPIALRGKRIAIHAGVRPMRINEVDDLVSRMESGDATPCLDIGKALPFLRRVSAGLPRKRAKGSIARAPGFFDPHDPIEAPRAIEPLSLPYSAIVCVVTLGVPKRGDECAREFGVGAGNDSDRIGHFNWGWPMLDVQPLIPSREACGAQGFWDWNGVCP